MNRRVPYTLDEPWHLGGPTLEERMTLALDLAFAGTNLRVKRITASTGELGKVEYVIETMERVDR